MEMQTGLDPFIPSWNEIAHTADWALHVQAPDVAGLLATAAQGMYALMEVRLAPTEPVTHSIRLNADDLETLLVSFLSELLYLCEEQRLAFDSFDLHLHGGELSGTMGGGRIAGWRKEIKAVTYHNLRVCPSKGGFETTIVFDV